MLNSLGPRRGIVFGVVVAIALLATFFIVVRGGEDPIPVQARGLLPVVLVHGYGGDSSSTASLQARLERQGIPAVAVDLPNGGIGDITQSAAVVADAVEATGSPSVDLVGFSMGGLVIRAYLEHHGGAEHARYVITLGSPHHGTNIAGAAVFADPSLCVDACEQMTPDSSFLAELNEDDETPDGPTFVSIYTAYDETVTPPETAALDGAINVEVQSVCPELRTGHGELPREPLVLGVIVDTLQGGLLEEPGPERCSALTALGR